MLNILIKKDNYAYLNTNGNSKLFSLLLKSFSRKEKVFNNFYRMYEMRTSIYYGLVDNKKFIKIKAGLVPFLVASLDKNRIQYRIIDERKKLKTNINIITRLNNDVELRKYQYEAVKAIFNVSYGVVQLPTSSGKTEISSSIIKSYFTEYNDAILYVVPTVALQKEAKTRFESYGIDTNLQFPLQQNKVNIITYMGLIRADNNKLGYKQRDTVGMIIFDEAHHLSADKSSKIVHRFNNLRSVIGMTATPSNDLETKTFLKELNSKELTMFGCTGPVAYKMEIDETIDYGFVTPIEVRVVDFYTKHSLGEDENDWHIIKRVILKDEERAQFVANYTKHIFDDANLNTVVLLIPEVQWSRQYMKHIADLYKNSDVKIFELYGSGAICEYINNKPVSLTSSTDKDRVMDEIRNPNIKTIFSATTFFFEGINIKNLQAVINCYGGRDSKRIKQQCGRAMRLFNGKNVAYIHEIKDCNNPVLLSQFRHRIDIYKQEYNAKIVYSSFGKNI